jgi:class 3 adenylate cyclase
MSAAAYHAAGNALPPGATFRDLGIHQLKDLPEPERLFQLVAARRAERLPSAPHGSREHAGSRSPWASA